MFFKEVALTAISAVGVAAVATANTPLTFTAAGAFPTTAFTRYFNSPTQTSEQVQPVVSDPVEVRVDSLRLCYILLRLKICSTKSIQLPSRTRRQFH